MRLVDTHCHLTEPPLADQIGAVLTRAAQHEVTRVVAPAYDHASWSRVAALRTMPGVSIALGVHPWVAAEGVVAEELDAALRETRAIAVGEIGLDFKIDEINRREQTRVLATQLDVAVALDLPVILHCRGAFEELLALILAMPKKPRGLIHAFSRGPELARRFLDLGLHIAVGGAATRADSRVRKALLHIPGDRLLLETDAPSIGLEGVLAEQTEPMHVAYIAAAVAAIRNETIEEVAAQTTANAQRLFGLG